MSGSAAAVLAPDRPFAGSRAATDGREERRSAAPLDLLSRRLDTAVTGAVDALQIAAALEADGLTDALARDRYGLPDVFAVAETLHRRVPLRATTMRADAPRVSRSCIAHGALFALPGVYFLALQDAIASRLATVLLVAVTVGGWAAGQAMSVLAHTVLGRRGRPAALFLLRRILIASVLAVCAIGLGGVARFGWDVPLTAVAVGLGLYIVAATSLLFTEAGLLLACMLAPGAIAAGAAALGAGWPDGAVVTAMSASVALVVAAALWRTRGAAAAGALPRRSELARTVPFTAYGGLAGALVAAPLIGALVTGTGGPAMLALGILPLTLSMGFAELELRKHEAAIRVALGREHDLTGFARAASRILLAATARYVSALTALSALVLVSVAIAGRSPWQDVPLLGAYLLLGAALFLGLVMAATGNVTTVVASLAGAVTVVAVFQGLAGTSVEQSFTVGCAGLFAALALDAFHGVKQVGNHR